MPNRPRLALVDAYPHAFRGAQLTLLEIARGVEGFEPVVVTTGAGGLADRARTEGLPTEVLPYPRALARYGGELLSAGVVAKAAALVGTLVSNLRFLRVSRRRGIDVVYCSNTRSVLAVGLAARVRRLPVVWYVQQLETSLGAFDRAAARLATTILTISARSERVVTPSIRRRHGHKIGVVPLGVDVPDGPGPGLDGPPRGGPVRLVFVGEVEPLKGVDQLVDAVVALCQGGADVVLDIVGSLDHRAEFVSELRATADDALVGDRVRFLGFRSDVLELVAGSDILVLPSMREGLPRVVMEAMAASVAVVATDTGAVPDLVTDGVTGRLVPAGDLAALTKALDELVRSPAERHRLARSGYQHVAEHFTTAGFVDEMTAHLQKARRRR